MEELSNFFGISVLLANQVRVWQHGVLLFNHVCTNFGSFNSLKENHVWCCNGVWLIASRRHFYMNLNAVWCGLWSEFIFIFTLLLYLLVYVFSWSFVLNEKQSRLYISLPLDKGSHQTRIDSISSTYKHFVLPPNASKTTLNQ